MILLNQVVEIFVRPHFDVSPARMLTSQQPQRAPTGNMPIQRHFARYPWQGGRERLAKERLRRRDSAVAAQQEVDRLPVLVDGTIQIVPLRFDLEWSERPDVVELFSGLSAPNRTCTLPRRS